MVAQMVLVHPVGVRIPAGLPRVERQTLLVKLVSSESIRSLVYFIPATRTG